MDKQTKLTAEAEEKLREMVGDMMAGCNRFPPESQLAKELNISRATLREALAALIRDGFVTPRHGSGNYGHSSALKMPHRIDLCGDFIQLSDAGGQTVEVTCQRCGFTEAPAVMKRYYPVPCDEIYELHWVYRSDGRPTILSRIYIPKELIIGDPAPSQENGREKLSGWIRRCCGRDFAYYSTYLSCNVDADACRMLELPEDTPMQNWRQVTYDLFDEPVAFCDNFFHPDNIELSVIIRP